MAKKKAYRYPLYLVARGAAEFSNLLPQAWAMALARFIGGIAFETVSRQREKALTHLRQAFASSMTEEEIRALGKKVFENMAMTLAEIIRFPKIGNDIMSLVANHAEVAEVYRRILAEGKGVISVTAHVGNWELLGGIVFSQGFPGLVLGRRIYFEPYNRWIINLRKAVKVETLDRDHSSREIMRRLRRNEIVGLLPDQDIESLKGIFVPFFGKLAHTPISIARISVACDAPILPNFMIREGNRYRAVFGEVIRPVPGADREKEARRMTEEWMRQFEKIIRQYPEQWAWMHDRWKTQPAEENVTEVIKSS